MADKFHQAARDGYLDLLREATRKDCDRHDEDGMTPTTWAAYHGNLDALRLIVSRGGNPDKCDYLGNSALHCSAANGHMNCVSFLVNFGANIWSLDNDFHTPLDVAAIHEHEDIVQFLDVVVAKQSALNKRVVKKLKERAVLDAQKRVKLYQKLQSRAQHKAALENKKMKKIEQKMQTGAVITPPSKDKEVGGLVSSHVDGEHNANTYDTTKSHGIARYNQSPRVYSDHFNPQNGRSSRKHGGVVMKKINKKKLDNGFKISETDGADRRSVRALKGLQRDSEVLYVKEGVVGNATESKSLVSRSFSEPGFHQYSNGDSGIASYDDAQPQESASLFERPGLGSIAFFSRHNPVPTGAMMSLPYKSDAVDVTDVGNGVLPESDSPHSRPLKNYHTRKNSLTDSIGTLGSLAHRMREVPWDEDDVESLDDDEVNEGSPIELFLASYGLTEFIPVFTREKIDLDALLLCSDSDLKDVGVPLGPRRKIIDAAAKRRDLLKSPDIIKDTYL